MSSLHDRKPVTLEIWFPSGGRRFFFGHDSQLGLGSRTDQPIRARFVCTQSLNCLNVINLPIHDIQGLTCVFWLVSLS